MLKEILTCQLVPKFHQDFATVLDFKALWLLKRVSPRNEHYKYRVMYSDSE